MSVVAIKNVAMCYQMPLKGLNHPFENHWPRASQSKPDSPRKLKEKANPKTYQRPVDSESHRLGLKLAGTRDLLVWLSSSPSLPL